MKMFVTYRDIPEMRSIPEAERAGVWRSFLRSHGYFSKETFITMTVFLFVIVAAAIFAEHIGAALFVLLLIAGALASVPLYLAQLRKPFREFLSKSS